MIQNLANTIPYPRYIPRHAAQPTPWKERARIILRCLDRAMDKDMDGPALALCGLLLGVIGWPIILYCYFG